MSSRGIVFVLCVERILVNLDTSVRRADSVCQDRVQAGAMHNAQIVYSPNSKQLITVNTTCPRETRLSILRPAMLLVMNNLRPSKAEKHPYHPHS